MIENDGGPTTDGSDPPEPIRDDRDGSDPAANGDTPESREGGDSSAGDDPAAIDLEAVRDRAS